MTVIQCSVQGKFKPIASISRRQPFTDPGSTGSVLQLGGIFLNKISHGIRIVPVCKGIQRQFLVFGECHIKYHHTECIPITVDVLRLYSSSASQIIRVLGTGNAVQCVAETEMRHDSSLFFCIVIIIEQTEIIRE